MWIISSQNTKVNICTKIAYCTNLWLLGVATKIYLMMNFF